jgi:hypothetical protein
MDRMPSNKKNRKAGEVVADVRQLASRFVLEGPRESGGAFATVTCEGPDRRPDRTICVVLTTCITISALGHFRGYIKDLLKPWPWLFSGMQRARSVSKGTTWTRTVTKAYMRSLTSFLMRPHVLGYL